MAKSSTFYVCQSCGASAPKWSGKCEACGGWNTIVEEGAVPPLGGGASRRVKGRKISLEDLKTEDAPPKRRPTGFFNPASLAASMTLKSWPTGAFLSAFNATCSSGFFPTAAASWAFNAS
ncbi:MAG TPA: hypothetical protein VLL04_04465, partial [Rhizomicrobium sp.]|nr:hypothetical protein [Rhizomicrobium sp.]